MKKSLVIMALLVVTSMFMVGNSYADTPIYEDSWQQVLSLWSGAAGDITDSEITDPYEGGDDICAKFSFPKEITWAKIGAQAFGGAIPLDLTGHTKMQFNVSANKEGVVAHFGVGSGTLDEDSCGEHTVAGDPITISSTGWTAAEIDLSKQNMSAVTNLWWMMLAAGENSSLTNPIEVFVDDIKYVGGGAGIITVTISGGTVGVSVSGNMAFGDSSYGIEMISSENAVGDKYLTVANIGDVNEDFLLKVLDPPGWSSSADETPGFNEYVIYGVVSNTDVTPGSIITEDFGAEDIITTTSQECADSGAVGKFDSDDSGNGVAVSWDSAWNNTRAVWIRLKTPTGGSISGQQTIRVVVTAEKS